MSTSKFAFVAKVVDVLIYGIKTKRQEILVGDHVVVLRVPDSTVPM